MEDRRTYQEDTMWEDSNGDPMFILRGIKSPERRDSYDPIDKPDRREGNERPYNLRSAKAGERFYYLDGDVKRDGRS